MYKRQRKITSWRIRPSVCSEFILLIHLCFGDLATNARDIKWPGSHHSLLVLACQVSTAMFWVQFRSMCLNHFNLPLLFLQLEAVIAEVRKCGPTTQGSQINSCLAERLPNMLWDIVSASSLCSGWLACPAEQRLSITYSLSSWQNVRNVDVKALTIPPLVLSPFFSPLYIKTDKINPNANCRA